MIIRRSVSSDARNSLNGRSDRPAETCPAATKEPQAILDQSQFIRIAATLRIGFQPKIHYPGRVPEIDPEISHIKTKTRRTANPIC